MRNTFCLVVICTDRPNRPLMLAHVKFGSVLPLVLFLDSQLCGGEHGMERREQASNCHEFVASIAVVMSYVVVTLAYFSRLAKPLAEESCLEQGARGGQGRTSGERTATPVRAKLATIAR